MRLTGVDEFFEELEYDLTSQLLHRLRHKRELKRRVRLRVDAIVQGKKAYSQYAPGTIWLVDDRKVHFRGRRDGKSYHVGGRPGVVLFPPEQETQYEVCWIPGSSQLAGRLPDRTVISQNTAYLLCEREWYLPWTLESPRGKIAADKLLELQQKWDKLECDEESFPG